MTTTPNSIAPEEVLGIATCPTCNKRFRLLKKHAGFIGKEIQCPKCHRPFVVQITTPSPIEQAAIANAATVAGQTNTPNGESKAGEAAAAKKAKKRRTKAEIRKQTYATIKAEFRPFLKRLRAIAEIETSSEEEVRRWCIDVFRTVLGYEDSDLDTELNALSQRIDIAVKHDGKVILIVECKNVRARLNTNTRDQAVSYAVNKSADWAVITNGQEWTLLRIVPVKGHDPRIIEVFSLSLLDEDGLSLYDIERMYLLTQRALLRGETEQEFHLAQCLDNQRVLKALTSERVINVMRKVLIKEYRGEFKENVKVRNGDVAECLQELTRPSEL